jgi:hypothetical protein
MVAHLPNKNKALSFKPGGGGEGATETETREEKKQRHYI